MVGAALGILGLLLFFAGVIARFWFVIVIGLYFIGVLATPRSPRYAVRFENQLTAEAVRAELDRLLAAVRGRAPKEVQDKVSSIRDSIIELLPYILDINSADYTIYTIRQTALDYLPTALENYLNLPRAFAQIHPIKDGKSATHVLLEQLDLLDKEMKEIAQGFYRNDTQELLAHGRFLEEKFRLPDPWFSPR
jgi:hypothetical protein